MCGYVQQVSVLAAFTQTSEGDSSPNTQGERCESDNSLCDYKTSTCPEAPRDVRKTQSHVLIFIRLGMLASLRTSRNRLPYVRICVKVESPYLTSYLTEII